LNLETCNATKCLVCGETAFEPRWDILLRCRNCQFVTARLDGPVNARGLYEGDYFKGEEYLDYQADEFFFKRNFEKRLRQLLQRRSNGRLLEIGAAYGFFLDLARKYFDVVGFEVNAEAVAYAREKFRVDIRTDDFLKASAADVGGGVDVTVMWDVIEHLERPDEFISHIRELSNPGALLYITTGDIGSGVARWRGRKWRMIHPPSHLHYFDRGTIQKLLVRHGFEVLDLRSVGVSRSLLQVIYSIMVLQLGMPRAYSLAEKIVPAQWGFTLNTYDIMHVVAKVR
jgi:SAM-dependent methyltransferase